MRNRKVTIGIVIALVFAVVSLGIAFAAFSTTLNITGSASVESSNWNVFLTTADNGSDPGPNGVSLPSNRIFDGNDSEGTTTQNVSTLLTSNTFSFNVIFKSPGDYIDYYFYIRNAGDYDAIPSFSNVSCIFDEDGYYCNTNLVCTQNGVVTQEASTVCSHLHYYVEIHSDDGGVIKAGESYYIDLFITSDYDGWAQDGSDLPKNPVTVTASPIVLTATQASSAQ